LKEGVAVENLKVQAEPRIVEQTISLMENDKETPKFTPSQNRPVRQIRRAGRIIFDFGLANLAFVLAFYLRTVWSIGNEDAYIAGSLWDYAPLQLVFAAGLVILLYARGFYSNRRITGFVDESIIVLKATILMGAAMLVMAFLTRPFYFSRQVLITVIPFALILLVIQRLVARLINRYLWKRGINTRKLLIIGATNSARRVMDKIVERPDLGYILVGYVDDKVRFSRWTMPVRYRQANLQGQEVPHLGKLNDLDEIIDTYKVEEIIVALPASEHDGVNQVISLCQERQVAFTLLPDVFELPLATLDVQQLNGVPLISFNYNKLTGWNYFIKRSIDVFGALVGILLSSPFMILAAIAIKLEDPKGPILFRQERVGKYGKVFKVLKFRSMVTNAEVLLDKLQAQNETGGITFKMKNDPRITKVGKFIRKTSIDELPQFFNILFGQMSFVGPRPGTVKEVAKYEMWHRRRLEVTPGLSGLWQVSGRSRLTFEDMVKLDIYYAEHWSLWMDLKIMLRTPLAVLKSDGAM
jgi:exopolysaccharide biosynthesis polyprenyl glycosylphosphotransferase